MTTPANSRRVFQFSIRRGLLLIAICALGIVIYQNFIYEPPTHKIPLYEKARPHAGTSAKVGPNVVRIKSVVRNDRNGGVQCEDGRGHSIKAAYPHKQLLIDCAAWLDVAQFELEPGSDLFDVQQVRIFDHETREFLPDVSNRIGWRLMQPNVLQLYGLGEELPERIDLWFRARSYQTDDRVVKLAASQGATVQFDNTTLTVRDIQRGYRGWSSGVGFLPMEGEHFNNFGVEIQCETSPPTATKYQFGVVLKDGRREIGDFFYRFDQTMVENFEYPLEDVDHFEIRPHRESPPFFFEGIQLPMVKSQGTKFRDPPTAPVSVSGKAIAERVLGEFAPLDIRLAIRDGIPFDGSSGGRRGNLQLKRNPRGPTDLGQAFTLVLRSFGMKDLNSMDIQYRLIDQPEWSSHSSSGMGATSDTNAVQGSVFRIPLDQVDEIKLDLLPAP